MRREDFELSLGGPPPRPRYPRNRRDAFCAIYQTWQWTACWVGATRILFICPGCAREALPVLLAEVGWRPGMRSVERIANDIRFALKWALTVRPLDLRLLPEDEA